MIEDRLLTEFARDQSFTIAWFGLMTMVWLGWAQESPPRAGRWPLVVGSVLGIALGAAFGLVAGARWSDGSALDGRYHWLGMLVAVEVIVAGSGCLLLVRRGAGRWMAWWVALVVAVHFIPLGLLLEDWSVVIFGILQGAGLWWLRRPLQAGDGPTSGVVGPFMGFSLLGYAVVSAVVFLVTS